MADLSVDVDGLARVAGALRGVADGLDNTRSVIDAAGDALGSGDVSSALDHFESHWDDGRGRIKKNMESMEKLLDESVKQYREADQKLANALRKHETTTHKVTGQ